jgi:hypothetical protein
MQASNRVNAQVSPDGQRLLMRRSVTGPTGGDEARFTVAPFGGGAEVQLNATGTVVGANWVDSVTVLVQSVTGTGARFAKMDVRTGATGAALQLPDSTIAHVVGIPDGFAWIPKRRDRVIVEQGAKRHEITKPRWFDQINTLDASSDGSRLLMVGWNPTDTLGLAVVPVGGGTPELWSRSFAESGVAQWLADGSIAFNVWSSTSAASVRKVTGPGQEQKLGAIAHLATTLTLSRDLKRAALMWREYRGDAWVYRVVKP